MGKWTWIILAGAVLYYLSKREQSSVKIQANRSATSATQHAGNAVNNLIDSGSSALGKWISGLGSSGGSSSSGGGGGYTTYSTIGYDSSNDPSTYVEEFNYGD